MTNDFNAILTPCFSPNSLGQDLVFCIKFAVSTAYKSLRNGDTVIIFLIVNIILSFSIYYFILLFLASFSTEMLFVHSK